MNLLGRFERKLLFFKKGDLCSSCHLLHRPLPPTSLLWSLERGFAVVAMVTNSPPEAKKIRKKQSWHNWATELKPAAAYPYNSNHARMNICIFKLLFVRVSVTCNQNYYWVKQGWTVFPTEVGVKSMRIAFWNSTCGVPNSSTVRPLKIKSNISTTYRWANWGPGKESDLPVVLYLSGTSPG